MNVNQPGALTLGSAVPQVGVAFAAGSPTDGDGFSEEERGQVFTYQWAKTTDDPNVVGTTPTWTPIDGVTANTYHPGRRRRGKLAAGHHQLHRPERGCRGGLGAHHDSGAAGGAV